MIEFAHAKSPRVTIGMPIYNGSRYLSLALDSVLTQTFADFEVIISDNASTDATEEICRDYSQRDGRIKYHRHSSNMGASPNFNFVVHEAVGEFFKWATHDDLMAPTFLKECLTTFDRYGDGVALVYPRTVIIDQAGESVEIYDDGMNLPHPSASERVRALTRNPGMSNAIFGLHHTHTLKASRLLEAFPASDEVLLTELALLGRFIRVESPLFYRRVHGEMSMRANRNAWTRALWFDPRGTGRTWFVQWRIVRETLGSIDRVIATGVERRQLKVIFLREFIRQRWKALLMDPVRACVAYIAMLRTRS